MKKLLIGISLVSILAFGTVAFAQGMGGWGGGHMGGSNNVGHMMDRSSGGHMGGQTGQRYEEDETFLDETVDIRKELHGKRFEYAEASRDPNTTIGTIRALEKEIYDLERKVNEKAPATRRGYGANR